MTSRPAVAAIAVLLFVVAQVAPGVHEALEAGHDSHACCTDRDSSHVDTCGPDHDEGPCPVCAANRAPLHAGTPSNEPVSVPAATPDAPAIECVASDPFHVVTPDLRAPPA